MLDESQRNSAELRLILLAMEQAWTRFDASAPDPHRRGAAAVKAFLGFAERIRQQVLCGELQIDMVLAAQLRDGCAWVVKLARQGASGTELAQQAGTDCLVLERNADAFFGGFCRRMLAG